MDIERRLSDRILYALDLALDQNDIEVAEHLKQALELAVTRFGGAGNLDHRELSPAFEAVLTRFDALRDRQRAAILEPIGR